MRFTRGQHENHTSLLHLARIQYIYVNNPQKKKHRFCDEVCSVVIRGQYENKLATTYGSHIIYCTYSTYNILLRPTHTIRLKVKHYLYFLLNRYCGPRKGRRYFPGKI